MKVGDLVFVYGTLRRGERADLSSGFYHYGIAFIGKDKINGRLYHLGSFPGVKITGLDGDFEASRPIIHGEVFRILDASIISILDSYEGYNPDAPKSGLYDRERVLTAVDRPVWVYTYNGPTIEEQRIDSGDWCKNRQTTASHRKLQT